MTNNIHAALERLLPCPFCGGEATLNDHRLLWVVHCSSCSACVMGNQAPEPEEESPESYWEPFRQSAVDNWNRRAALATEVGEGPRCHPAPAVIRSGCRCSVRVALHRGIARSSLWGWLGSRLCQGRCPQSAAIRALPGSHSKRRK